MIGVLALPWVVVAAAMVLAVAAATVAAARPARAITRVPIVTALSGRPAPARRIRRSAVPGTVCLAAAFLLLAYSGGTNDGNGSGGAPELVLGIVLLIPGLILLARFLLWLTARLGGRAPIAARLALRDLARYRARSGSAPAAIGVGVLVAVIVMLAAAARYGNVFDWAGPNLTANQLALHYVPPPPAQAVATTANGGGVAGRSGAPAPSPARLAASADSIARALGARPIALETPDAQLNGSHLGRSWDGAIYVATPKLLRAFGIKASAIDPTADILSSRPGLADVSGLVLDYGRRGEGAIGPAPAPGPRPAAPRLPVSPTR